MGKIIHDKTIQKINCLELRHLREKLKLSSFLRLNKQFFGICIFIVLLKSNFPNDYFKIFL